MPVGRDEEAVSQAETERLMVEIASSLEAAMRVQPSGDFLARVRVRIAEERARAAPPWPGWLSRAVAPALVLLAVILAAMLGREAGVSDPVPTRSAASETAEPPASARPSPALSPPRARPARHRATAGAARVPVLVEAGQLETLARLAAHARAGASLPAFAVVSLEAAPVPELRTGDLPRFMAERLEVRPGGWQEQKREAGTAPDGNEGSGS